MGHSTRKPVICGLTVAWLSEAALNGKDNQGLWDSGATLFVSTVLEATSNEQQEEASNRHRAANKLLVHESR